MTVRNEIKAQIVRAGYTMQEVVDRLHEEYGWSDSVSNLSAKLQRESIRYKEVMQLADVLGYDIYWGPRKGDAVQPRSFCRKYSIVQLFFQPFHLRRYLQQLYPRLEDSRNLCFHAQE